MLKKKTLAYLFLLIISWATWAYLYYYNWELLNNLFLNKFLNKSKNINEEENQSSSWLTETWSSSSWVLEVEDKIDDEKKAAVKAKIELLRKRYSLNNILAKWDIYQDKNIYEKAIENYNKILENSPNDPEILKKLADAYYDMKDFWKSYENYKKILDLDYLDKNKVALSLLLSNQIFSENIPYLNWELDNLWLNSEQLFYFKNSLSCINDFSLCKKNFEDYFKENEEINFKFLSDVKIALDNFNNSKIDDLYYKWSLVIWSFFENYLYTIAIPLWKKILLEKPWYKPILKIVWKSYFEIWDDENADKFLKSYFDIDPEDLWVIYLLWVTNLDLWNYILSNVFLNKALDKGYTPAINIRRRIIYNYYKLEDNKRMLSFLKDLVKKENDNIDKNDLAVVVYYHIINDEKSYAKEILQDYIKDHPDDDTSYAYLWYIEKEEWNIILAETYLDKWYEINSKSPILNLYKWQLEKEKWENTKAFIYFKKTIALDRNWEFWILAKEELDNLDLTKK